MTHFLESVKHKWVNAEHKKISAQKKNTLPIRFIPGNAIILPGISGIVLCTGHHNQLVNRIDRLTRAYIGIRSYPATTSGRSKVNPRFDFDFQRVYLN